MNPDNNQPVSIAKDQLRRIKRSLADPFDYMAKFQGSKQRQPAVPSKHEHSKRN